ncbi:MULTISPECIES: sulfur carrier protein ThiS [Sinomonas]|jgi:sulfur carrier protein|uniref:Sulfur carrier protein ThiS n=1 Tax=Sinomonas flava TaxID=496857 RepID=A0ABN3BNT9_9MICC|nr:sulfur carrier protein ThiS [Sinomonas sp. R1AF57]ASN52453.1 thiamine biosynthesis protein ThiS [Sinomonas sp. R1AF57]
MNITVNGEPRALPQPATVRALVAETIGREIGDDGRPADGGRLGVAVALNSEVVPRGRWAGTVLEAGDAVELVTAMQGG